MTNSIPLTRSQEELMREFYSFPLRRVLFSKTERNFLWNTFKTTRTFPASLNLEVRCPALAAEIAKSLVSGNLVQSAVFSECVYAQGLADHLGLVEFADCASNFTWLDSSIRALLSSYSMVARYMYRSVDGSRMLIQAGGHGGVDGALISVQDKNVFTIEFKEPGAKTSEPDLPKYSEDGEILLTDEWAGRYPQFVPMMKEQVEKGLNFWSLAGTNIHSFTPASVQQAVSENYSGKKFADVICTEDVTGVLTMIPSNQAHIWADVRGEIRPAGRNHYTVWTPLRLEQEIIRLGGSVTSGVVRIDLSKLVSAKPRGGMGISRYKITPLFFVRSADVAQVQGSAMFKLSDVRQLNPTISAHMFFRELRAAAVKPYYMVGG